LGGTFSQGSPDSVRGNPGLISFAPLEPQSGFAQIPEIRGWTLRRLSSLKRVLKIHESAA